MNAQTICFLMLLGIAVCVSYIDLRKQLIPDEFNIVLLMSGVGSVVAGNQPGLWNGIWGALVGFVVLITVQYAYRSYRGFEGLGGGDVKFVAAAGMWVGLAGLPWLILIASISGLTGFILMAFLGRARTTTRLPFGPHLALGLVLTWLALQRGVL